MQRVASHLTGAIARSAQTFQQIFRSSDSGSGRSVQPLQFEGTVYSHGAQGEAQLRQLAPQDLRRILIAPEMKVIEGIEPDDTAWRSAICAACALGRRCFADARDFERGQSRPR